MPESPRGVVRRIVTAIPASADVTSLLRLAARMAGQCDANVAAVLVQNESLLRLASLPVTRHLLAATGAAEPLTAQMLRLALAASGREVRERLDALLGASHIAWSLHTQADEAAAVLPLNIQSGDLLLVSVQAGMVETWFEAEPAAAAFAVGGEGDLARDVAVVHDGSGAGARAFDAAVLLARAQGGHCHVVVPATLAAATLQDIDAGMAASGVPGHRIVAATAALTDTERALRQSGAGVVVLPAGILRQPGLAAALRRLAGGAP
jgi:hypothetical protein